MRDYDHVLIVAGAGLSVFPPNLKQNVYVSKEDFKYRYPHVQGYETSYDAMASFFDPSLDLNTKWGYQAQHMDNMSAKFKPNRASVRRKRENLNHPTLLNAQMHTQILRKL